MMIRPTKTHHLLNDLAFLVDFNRIDAPVGTRVVVLFNGALESLVELVNTAVQNICKAQQQRQTHAALAHFLDQDLQVNGWPRRALWRHQHMAGVADTKVVVAPLTDTIQVNSLNDTPWLGNRLAFRLHYLSPF